MIDYDLTVTLPLLLSVLALIFTWWRTRDQNAEAKFKAGSDRMDRHEMRLNSVEQTLRSMPARDDLHELRVSMTELKGELKTVIAVIEGNNKLMTKLDDVVNRHEQHLLEGNKR